MTNGLLSNPIKAPQTITNVCSDLKVGGKQFVAYSHELCIVSEFVESFSKVQTMTHHSK